MSAPTTAAPRPLVRRVPQPAPTAVPARVDLAGVLGARDQLAAIAGGDGLLMHTGGLGAGDPTRLVHRAAEAALMLAYARGGPVTHLDSPPNPDGWHLLADAAAPGRPVLSARLVEELIHALPAGPVRERVLTPMWHATRFAEAHDRRPRPAVAPLLCTGSGGGERPVPGGAGRYDPAAHVLRAGPGDAGRFAGLLNPLLADVAVDDLADLPALCDRLDPAREPGRLVLRLPGNLLRAGTAALAGSGHRVVWLVSADDDAGRFSPGVCLGEPGRDEGGWLLDRAARLAAAMLS